MKYTLTVILDPNKPVEIRNLEIENTGSTEEIIEVIYEKVLSEYDEKTKIVL